MNETVRTPRVTAGGPSALRSLFEGDDDSHALITVSSGPYLEHLPLSHPQTTVGELRRRFRTRFDIDPNAQAMLDGQEVGDEVVVRQGQALMFTRRAGEKGRGRAGSALTRPHPGGDDSPGVFNPR